MKYFQQEITELTDSNIPQDWNEWNSENTYTYEDDDSLTNASVVTHNNYYWRSASINNTEEPSEKSLKWAYLNETKEDSVSNRLALIDNRSSTRTTVEDEDLVVEFKRNQITTVAVGSFEATEIKVEHLDDSKVLIPEYTQIFEYKPVEGINSWFSYWFAKKVYEVNHNELININPNSSYVRITFKQTYLNKVSVGFLQGGRPIYVGTTVDDVTKTYNSYKTEEQNEIKTSGITQNISFTTQASRNLTVFIENRIKELKNGTVAVFIVDDTKSTLYKNMIVLGELESAPITIDSFDEHITSWTVYENP